MVHLSEDVQSLAIETVEMTDTTAISNHIQGFDDVCVVVLPSPDTNHATKTALVGIEACLKSLAHSLGPNATIIILGEAVDLVKAHAALRGASTYQLLVAIKRSTPLVQSENRALPLYHYQALVHTKYSGALQHTKTRIQYTYCPACGKTTKDYGGKKHTYHHFGTLMSDVWRDISVNPEGDLASIYERFADLFGLEPYRKLLVLDCRSIAMEREAYDAAYDVNPAPPSPEIKQNIIVNGDCLETLQSFPENSMDFVFVDPPYNLAKKYGDYSDDLEISEYFAWCDRWLTELARVLKPGRTCAVLNIPLWSIRHFLHMETILQFQNWIAWDALSFPVRKIMPAHYAILCFSKGQPRPLPGLYQDEPPEIATIPDYFQILEPLAEDYCLRARCVARRQARINDRGLLTDLWWDIHRLKHNRRRVDHPTQLPPQLMYRLIAIFTQPGENVLDCFNGSGTTTLAAHQLGRNYIGIELEEKYYDMALARHQEVEQGLDPFRKADRKLTAKNSRVPRVKKQNYKVSKKTLQLEVKRIAQELGHLPTKDEIEAFAQFPLTYYEDYFISWGEVYAAARTTGMSEDPPDDHDNKPRQLRLF